VSGRLLLVLAHPDDESMGNGTLIARAAARGVDVRLVCATRGGAGWNGRPAGATPEQLPEIRQRELEAAAGVLGIAGVELWDYPDGGVAACDQDEISARIADAVDRLAPTVVVGWGPDGGYGHPDHVAVGACTDRTLRGRPLPHYHMASDGSIGAALQKAAREIGVSLGDLRVVTVPDRAVDIHPTAAEADLVGRAIACHDSQRSPLIDHVLTHPELLFGMACNGYARVSGPVSPPDRDLLPELR
jgi:LmbE family N-acetylglucosaminyl deacetylase